MQVEPGKPARLLDRLLEIHSLKNDAALARRLDVTPPVISRLRHGRKVTAAMMLNIHQTFGMPFAEMRALCGSTEARAGGTR